MRSLSYSAGHFVDSRQCGVSRRRKISVEAMSFSIALTSSVLFVMQLDSVVLRHLYICGIVQVLSGDLHRSMLTFCSLIRLLGRACRG